MFVNKCWKLSFTIALNCNKIYSLDIYILKRNELSVSKKPK